ncbi:MAG TPA: 3-phosphoshikimate 1-carboxyvinyltransferase [Acidobacteriota bacterium]|jgi:3-phosphoshikimate 1-carboxyvinyltransferase
MWVHPANKLQGNPELPGDKSISHRYAMLSALCPEVTIIENYSPSEDCRHTLDCLAALGAYVSYDSGAVRVQGKSLGELRAPGTELDCGNSGTTIRLLSGILAAQKFESVLTGDDSLRSRPMGRILVPLRKMGAALAVTESECAPIRIAGRPLHGIEYVLPVASAQVKSCVILAGLHARGSTEVVEPIPSRSHTERALPLFGVDVEIQNERIAVRGGQQPRSPGRLRVPADPSAAAFFCVAACLIPGAEVRMKGINYNPARVEWLRLLLQSGANIRIENQNEVFGEPIADLTARYDPAFLEGFPAKIGGKMIPSLIDEIPILSVLGARLPRGLEIRDAAELRHKETDRIRTVAENLQALGAKVEEFHDGLQIHPCRVFSGGRIESRGDHRIAMAFAVAGLLADTDVEIRDSGCAAVSFPGFFKELEKLSGTNGTH